MTSLSSYHVQNGSFYIDICSFLSQSMNEYDDTNTSGFQNGRHVGILFPVRLWPFHRHRHVCIGLPNVIQMGPHTAELWRHTGFSRWRPRHRKSASGFGFGDVTNEKVEIYGIDQISSIYLNPRLRYCYFLFQKQTAAIVGFHFRF